MSKNIGIITQARIGSTRLPGKIFKKVNDKELLLYHVERLQKTNFKIIIATSTKKEDDVICEFAAFHKISYYRGSELNVLSRFYNAAKEHGLDIIVRVTSDCPFIDPDLIFKAVNNYLKLNNTNIYLSNTIQRTYARGFDFEIFSIELLENAFKNAYEESEQEHVTPFMWKNRSGKCIVKQTEQINDNSHLRLTVDTPEDFELIKLLITNYNAQELTHTEIENILLKHPELVKINAHIEQKKV